MENYFEIGKIVNAQGIKGDVRVVPFTDEPTRFELLTEAIIRFDEGTRKGVKHFPIERVWHHKGFVMLKLKGIDDRNVADTLRGGVIVIPPELALPLDEGEYYIRDLLGMAVVTTQGERLGVICDVLQTGANDVFSVKPEPKSKVEILVPHIKQCVLNVDVENKLMTVELLEGLR